MTDWYLGTIGFTYPEWKGSFYPPGLPSGQALNYYSKVFNAVEINTTFYGPQPASQIERWAAATPDDFCFCLKAPKRITHELRLQPEADREMLSFIDASLPLSGKLGAFLLQLPPSFKADQVRDVERFLAALPTGGQYANVRYAIELRHESWHAPEAARRLTDLLRHYGICWVTNDYEDLPLDIHLTTDFLYIRWIAKHNVIPHPGYEVIDRQQRLAEWLERINPLLDDLKTIFGFFDNDYAGHAPATCNRLKTMLGLPVVSTPAEDQGRLF
jgi:uncharacterized protein YecE (DUF72 family)